MQHNLLRTKPKLGLQMNLPEAMQRVHEENLRCVSLIPPQILADLAPSLKQMKFVQNLTTLGDACCGKKKKKKPKELLGVSKKKKRGLK